MPRIRIFLSSCRDIGTYASAGHFDPHPVSVGLIGVGYNHLIRKTNTNTVFMRSLAFNSIENGQFFMQKAAQKKCSMLFVSRSKHGEHFFCVAFHMKKGSFSIEFNALEHIKTVFAFIRRKKFISTQYSPLLLLTLLRLDFFRGFFTRTCVYEEMR